MTGVAERIAAAESLLDGLSGHALAARAARISEGYRDNRPSRQIIGDEIDAAIYALMRMPATAAAVGAALDALSARAPGFVPASVADIGAGPGTASLCVAEEWPEAERILCDAHPGLLALARRLMEPLDGAARFINVDFTKPQTALPTADLVIASYALTETDDVAYNRVAESLWTATAGALVVIEPGRPREYKRLMAFRDWAIGQGAHVAAPCPHMHECPLTDPDWCHFAVRLPRSRAHKRLKSGALGYEDEKYAYLVLTRPDVPLEAPQPRVLAHPEVKKHETRLKLCETDGDAGWHGMSRKSPQFRRVRRLKWGDTFEGLSGSGEPPGALI